MDEHYSGELPDIEEYDSGLAFLEHFTKESFDMIFLDQYMDGLSGMETAQKIREMDKLVPLIFVTTSRDFAVDSYSVRACGYLVKPYSYEDFSKAMQLTDMGKIRAARFILIGEERVLLREIIWCDRDDHYVRIHTDRRGILRLRSSFAELERVLAPYPQFMSCYRGCMINADRVQRMDDLNFLMDNQDLVPFRKRDKKNIEKQYSTYLFRRIREETLI